MWSNRIIAVSVAGLLCAFATGCRDLRSFDEVEAAFENPSGVLDGDSAPAILKSSIFGKKAGTANTLASSYSGVPGDVGSAMEFLLPQEGGLGSMKQALFLECAPDVKLRTNYKIDKVAFDCGSSGEITGKLILDLDWKGDELRGFFLDYEMFCDSATCVDGSMGVRWDIEGSVHDGISTSLIATVRITVTHGQQSFFVDWAWRLLLDQLEARFEWLVFTSPDRSGNSFVLSAVGRESGGHIELRDAVGWWRCDYGAEAREGECFRCEPTGTSCEPTDETRIVSWWTGED